VKSYVKRASKLSVSAHNIEFFTFLSQFACYAFPYFYSAYCHTVAMRFCAYSLFVATPLQCVSIHIPYLLPHRCNAFLYIFPICCHTVIMRFHTYSPFVATPLQCVSVHIPHLLPHRCNAFLYIFPICCHTVAMRFHIYSLFVATPLQCVSVHIPHLLPHRCNAFLYIFPICCHYFATRWLPNGYAKRLKVQCDAHSLVLPKYSNQQTEHILTKTVATPCKCHKYTPKTQKRGKQLPFW